MADILTPVCPPGLHKCVPVLLEVNVTLPPSLKVVGPPAEMLTVSAGLSISEISMEILPVADP